MHCEPADLLQVHRLDEATGGLLLVAKTRLGLQGLSSCFEQRQVCAPNHCLIYSIEHTCGTLAHEPETNCGCNRLSQDHYPADIGTCVAKTWS